MTRNMHDFITFALEGDIGQLPDIFLVQLHGLGSGDHIVGHVAVAAPGDEGTPVDVQVAAVDGGTLVQDPLRIIFTKFGKETSPLFLICLASSLLKWSTILVELETNLREV